MLFADWLVDHNMRCEAWHKKLKYFFLVGKKNRRIDSLINMLLVRLLMFAHLS